MGRLNFILVFFSCLLTIASKAQPDSTIHLSQQQFIKGDFTNFYIDNLGNVYLLNADNQVKIKLIKDSFPELKGWRYDAKQDFVFYKFLNDKTWLIILNHINGSKEETLNNLVAREST